MLMNFFIIIVLQGLFFPAKYTDKLDNSNIAVVHKQDIKNINRTGPYLGLG
jgi:Ni2+-binding GTPase involved in maturation of urease and hydrogenase